MISASAILLIFSLLMQPTKQATNFYRQATVAIGCFAKNSGKPWAGDYELYTVYRSTDIEPTLEKGLIVEKRTLNSTLKKAFAKDEGYSRIVILVDSAGASCADPKSRAGSPIYTSIYQIGQLSRFERWSSSIQVVPCADRRTCIDRLVGDLERG